MKQQSLFVSTLLLTFSSLLVRIIGMITIIFLTRLIGSEGIGIYELTISVYMTAVVFASAGLSTSVSKMVAEEIGRQNKGNIHPIMKAAFSFALTAGILVAIGLYILAPLFVKYIVQDAQVIPSLRILCFSLPFIACSSCFKGYFYALRKTLYPASSDILEQLVKLGLIFLFVNHYEPFGSSYTYQAAAMGLCFGEMFSWSYLCTLFLIEYRKMPLKASKTSFTINKTSLTIKEAFKKLLAILLPIAAISYVGYIFLSIENILIPSGFKKFGESFSTSMSLYGVLKGMVLPILFFPSAFLTAFSTTLIPEISKANALKLKHKVNTTTQRVLQLTLLFSILVVSVFLTYGTELGFILYKTEAVGPMLRVLTTIVPFVYMEVIADGILKGLDQQISCLKYSMLDSICRILLLYLLLPFKGIHALMGIMIASCAFTSLLNLNKLLSVTGITFQPVNWILKPAIAAAFASSYSRLILNRIIKLSLGLTTQVFLGMLLMLIMYVPLIFLVEAITLKDAVWLNHRLTLPRWQHLKEH